MTLPFLVAVSDSDPWRAHKKKCSLTFSTSGREALAAAPRGKPAAAPVPMAIRPAPTPLRVVAAVAVVALPIGLQLAILTLDDAVVEAAETAAASAMRVEDEESSIDCIFSVFRVFGFLFLSLFFLLNTGQFSLSIENKKNKNKERLARHRN